MKTLQVLPLEMIDEIIKISCNPEFCIALKRYHLLPKIGYTMDDAACAGHFDALKYLDSKGLKLMNNQTVDRASKNGHLDIVKYLYSKGLRGTEYALYHPSKFGHLEIVKFLLSRGLTATKDDIMVASGNGHLEILQAFHLPVRELGKAVYWACKHGHLEVVKWLDSMGVKFESSALCVASANNDRAMVEFLLAKGVRHSSYAVTRAGLNNHLEMVQFLHSKDIKGDQDSIFGAVVNGHLEIVKFLYSKGIKVEENRWVFAANPVEEAIKKGYLEGLTFLISNGLSMRDRYMEIASEYGHFEIVKCLHSAGAKVSKAAIEWAAKKKHSEIHEYLLSIQ